jgi:hypothetical protein
MRKDRMVCFDITLAYPLQEQKATQHFLQKRRLEHLRKYFNADILGTTTQAGEVIIRFAVCDFDAASLLRDIPEPMYCVQIKILREETLLYSNFKKTGTKVIPPRYSSVLKEVYWNASQLERRVRPSEKADTL